MKPFNRLPPDETFLTKEFNRAIQPALGIDTLKIRVRIDPIKLEYFGRHKIGGDAPKTTSTKLRKGRKPILSCRATDEGPVGQVKFPHPWPGQIPPGGTAGL